MGFDELQLLLNEVLVRVATDMEGNETSHNNFSKGTHCHVYFYKDKELIMLARNKNSYYIERIPVQLPR